MTMTRTTSKCSRLCTHLIMSSMTRQAYQRHSYHPTSHVSLALLSSTSFGSRLGLGIIGGWSGLFPVVDGASCYESGFSHFQFPSKRCRVSFDVSGLHHFDILARDINQACTTLTFLREISCLGDKSHTQCTSNSVYYLLYCSSTMSLCDLVMLSPYTCDIDCRRFACFHSSSVQVFNELTFHASLNRQSDWAVAIFLPLVISHLCHHSRCNTTVKAINTSITVFNHGYSLSKIVT